MNSDNIFTTIFLFFKKIIKLRLKNFALEKSFFVLHDAPLLRHQSPVGGRGAVRIVSHKVIRHYRNAGGAIAAGAVR